MDLSTRNWINAVFGILRQWEPLGYKAYPDGCRLIGHTPHIAPYAYLHRLPAPLSEEDLQELEIALPKRLPKQLRDLYLSCNGMGMFGQIEVFGMRHNYIRSDPDSALCQPFDFRTPNLEERPSYVLGSELIVGYYKEDGSYILVNEDGLVL